MFLPMVIEYMGKFLLCLVIDITNLFFVKYTSNGHIFEVIIDLSEHDTLKYLKKETF